MVMRLFLLVLVLLLSSVKGFSEPKISIQSEELKSVRGLPFSALIFSECECPVSYHISVLMSQDDISEENLKLLFQALSKNRPSPVPLDATVFTDLKTLPYNIGNKT